MGLLAILKGLSLGERMTSKLLKFLLTSLLLNSPVIGHSFPQINAPVHACTFYKSIWAPHFMGCAEPTVQPLSCKKVKYIGPTRVEYKGDYVSMYLPDFVIETNLNVGESLFANSGPTTNEHLKKALEWHNQETGMGLPSAGILDNGSQREKEGSYFWHDRLLPVPYGGFNHYPDVAGAAGGSTLPFVFLVSLNFIPTSGF